MHLTLLLKQVWHYSAFVNSDCAAYRGIADWIYLPNQPLSQYFGIPLHNFVGWFVTSLIISYDFACTFKDLDMQKRRSRVLARLTAVVALFSTISFYVIHPCHPYVVKFTGLAYLLLLGVPFFLW